MARRADSATAEIHDQGGRPGSNQVDYCGNAQVGDDVFFGVYGMYSQPPSWELVDWIASLTDY